MQAYEMGGLILQRSSKILSQITSQVKIKIYSSFLARAMQTAFLLAQGIRDQNPDVCESKIVPLPHLMEECSLTEAWLMKLIHQFNGKRRSSQNVTTGKDWNEDLKSLIEAFAPISPTSENMQNTDPILVSDIGKAQVSFFENFSSSFAQDDLNVVVSHGKYLRKLLLQTVIFGDKKNQNPHPRNTEAYLCEIVVVDEKVRGIVVRDHIPPTKIQASQSQLDKTRLDKYDVGKECTVTGSGSCGHFPAFFTCSERDHTG
jgi:broad specificity phosphatase PhoE